MGSLSRFDLRPLIKQGYTHYIETGLGQGTCLATALTYDFAEYHTCEIDPGLVARAEKLYGSNAERPYLHYHVGYSHVTMAQIVADLPADARCFFWLDAHFPFADGGSAEPQPYSADSTPENLPLESEFKIIAEGRQGHDVIICDDLRIYMDNPEYTEGNWPIAGMPRPGDGIQFVYDTVGESHDVQLSTAAGGFIICMPRAV